MIFLIEYNRSEGELVSIREFDPSQRKVAEDARLAIELDLDRRGVAREVVMLEADSEKGLRRTHQRYFADLSQLIKSASTRGE
jgi:hypothetical protein